MTAGVVSCGGQPWGVGWLFTGRRAVLRRVVAWMGGDAPGVLVVTGSAGCGKSAVVGYVAALSGFGGRGELLGYVPPGSADPGPDPDPDPDPDPGPGPGPGVGVVDAWVCLCGLGEQDLVVALAGQLGLSGSLAGWELIAGIAGMSSPPVVVLDGLDEVIPEHVDKVATELLVALGTVARVLLTTRQREFLWRGSSPGGVRVVGLREMFGREVSIIDLDDEVGTPGDIERYVGRRLRAGGRGDLVDRVAPVVAGRAGEFGGFLYAWIMTSQVLRGVVDVGVRGWQQRLAVTVGGAVDRDLSVGVSLVRDGVGVGGAARDLLGALAWNLGRGMPRVVWQAAATALSLGGVEYRGADVDWVLEQYGCYVVEDDLDGEVVYRLCHQEFVEHFLGSPLPVPGSAEAEVLAEALVALTEAEPPVEGEPDRRSPYLRRHLVRHASMAGTPGVDALYRLFKGTPEVYLPQLGVVVRQLATRLAELGQHEIALAPARQAVSVYRVLVAANAAIYVPFLALVLNDYAVYLAAIGQRESALVPGAEAVDAFHVLTETDPVGCLPSLVTSVNNLAGYLAGLDRISDGVDVYTVSIDGFAGSPEVRDVLVIERAGFHVRHGDPPTGFGELAALLGSEQSDTPDAVVLAARNVLRGHRHRDAVEVDRVWRAVNRGEPPDWLGLTPEQITVVVAWVTAPTWRESKSYLEVHEGVLLADAAFVALEELLLLVGPRAERHLDVLDEVMAVGIDAAYRPLLLEDLVMDWISAADWQESRSFAGEHAAELVTREAEVALIGLGDAAATVVHLAVLGLARQDGLQAAYDCVTDRRVAADRMRRALDEAEPNTIAQLALLEGRVFGESFAAAAHLAVAGSLIGEPISDTTRLEELAAQADLTERQRVSTEITELINRVPEHAEPLSTLTKILQPQTPHRPHPT